MPRTNLATFTLLVLLFTACAAPPLPRVPVTATETPPTSPPSLDPARSTPTALANAAPRPTRAETMVPPPTRALEPPELVYSIEPLEVLEISPANESTQVSVVPDQAHIAVRYSFPVVPFSALNQTDVVTRPVTIEPPIPFEGRWINSFTFAITPTRNLTVATQYTLTVHPTRDPFGHVSQTYTSTFHTITPQLIRLEPRADAGDNTIGLSQPITLTFNTEMDHASVEQRFRMMRQSDHWTALGDLTWQGNVMQFTPRYPYERDTTYTVELADGAQDIHHRGSAIGKSYVLQTIKPFALVKSEPGDGAVADTTIRDETKGVFIQFTQPVDKNGLEFSIVPPIAQPRTRRQYSWYDQAAGVWIYGGWQASTQYTITIGANTKSTFGEMLGREVPIHFGTAPMDPQFYLNLPAVGVFDANGPQTIYTTYANVSRIDYALYQLPRDKLFDLLLADEWNTQHYLATYTPTDTGLVRQWHQDLVTDMSIGSTISTTLRDALGRAPAPDVYYLRATTPQDPTLDNSVVFVTPMNLAFKYSGREVLVWATDLTHGNPVPNQPLTIYTSDGTAIASGKTDPDGVFRASITDADYDPYALNEKTRRLFALSEVNGHIVAAVASDWDQGIGKWDYNISDSGYWMNSRFGLNLYTDRSIYRTGQTVFFKGILRRIGDPSPDVPFGYRDIAMRDEVRDVKVGVTQVHARVFDANDDVILEQDLPVNEFGTFHGELALAENAPTGSYRIETEFGSIFFQVDEYRKPEFVVTVDADRAEYINGDTARVKARASYYFGGPVADADVTWRVLTEDWNPTPNIPGWWDFVDTGTQWTYDYSSDTANAQQLREGQARTDAAGYFEFEVPADIREYTRSQMFTLEAEIVDLNHQSVANRVSVPIHQGAFYIGLKPRSYIGGVGKNESVDLVTVNSISTGDDDLMRPHQPITVSIYAGEWYQVRRNQDGYFEWTSTYSETLLTQQELVTDDKGQAAVSFQPARSGEYRITAEGTDTRGNTIKSATWMWVWGRGYVGWKIDNTNRVQLVSDKKEYVPGDTAEILVPAPFSEGEALFTLERDNILQVERVHIEGNTAQLHIPIVEQYAPNIFVSVMMVKGRSTDSLLPQFKLGYLTLRVKPVAQALRVEVKNHCQAPLLFATNVHASPLPPDPEPAPPRPARVCQPKDTAVLEIQALDSLSRPVRAEFSVALVDKAVQALLGDNSTPLLSTFYQDRGLAINTATTLIHSIERDNQTLHTGAKGGGGGSGGSYPVRKDFKDTAYWDPVVMTDSRGHAQVEVKLPDNLTTWNITVKGVTRDTRVGQASADILSTRPLIVRPVTPRFFVVGDKTILEAVVNNNTDEAQHVSVTLETEGLLLKDSSPRTLTILAHDKAQVNWESDVQVTDHARLLFKAQASEWNDAVELTLPVQYPVTVQTLDSVEPVGSRLVKSIELDDASLLPNQFDQLQIDLTPSLAAASRDALKYLEAYDWECSEQTTSKFLPNIATYLALERLHLERQDLFFALQTNVSREIQRLYFLQNTDGGWGWWRNNTSRPVLTAYAVFALTQAKAVGFAVDKDVVRRATKFLQQSLDAPIVNSNYSSDNERAFTLYVLTQMGIDTTGRAVSLYEQRAGLDNYAKAFLLMVLARQKLPQAQTLLRELSDAATITDDYVYWKEKTTDYWMMNTDTRTQAIVILAIARLDPKNPLLPRAVKWLMQRRKLDSRFIHWETTQETAWSVLGLTEWMAASGELNGDYGYQVVLNGKLLADGRVDASNLDETHSLRVSVQETFQGLANEVIITRDTTRGTLYYSAFLRRYIGAEQIPAVSHGMVVQRTYFAVDPATLNATNRVVESARVGDYVQVKLTIAVLSDVNYLAVEDMLPAGFEAVDTSLKISSRAARGPDIKQVQDGIHHPYWWYWGHSELRDDRVALFTDWIHRGTYEYTYLIRAGVAGSFHALPTRAYAMYDPSIMGSSAGVLFRVDP